MVLVYYKKPLAIHSEAAEQLLGPQPNNRTLDFGFGIILILAVQRAVRSQHKYGSTGAVEQSGWRTGQNRPTYSVCLACNVGLAGVRQFQSSACGQLQDG